MTSEAKEELNLENQFIIQFDEKIYLENKQILMHGSFSTYVNCGSQYAIWGQFPQSIDYVLTDLDSNVRYNSIDNKLSISWDGNQVYEEYSKKPCNKIVRKHFSILLKDIFFINAPDHKINNFELSASYFSKQSNKLSFKDASTQLKSWTNF